MPQFAMPMATLFHFCGRVATPLNGRVSWQIRSIYIAASSTSCWQQHLRPAAPSLVSCYDSCASFSFCCWYYYSYSCFFFQLRQEKSIPGTHWSRLIASLMGCGAFLLLLPLLLLLRQEKNISAGMQGSLHFWDAALARRAAPLYWCPRSAKISTTLLGPHNCAASPLSFFLCGHNLSSHYDAMGFTAPLSYCEHMLLLPTPIQTLSFIIAQTRESGLLVIA